jgi:YVTN family beta-propeller protein
MPLFTFEACCREGRRRVGALSFRRIAVLPAVVALALLVVACCSRPPMPPRPYLAFVANEGSNTVAVVNLATFGVATSIAVAPEPVEVAPRPGSRELYAVSRSGTVSVIREPERRVAVTIPIGSSVSHLVFAPGGKAAALIDAAHGEVVFINCRSNAVEGRVKVGGDLSALAYLPDAGTLVAADRSADRLVFIEAQAKRILGEVKVGEAPGPMVIRSDANGHKVFVADTGEAKVSIVDASTHQLLSNVEIGSRPSGLVLKPDGGEVFVLSRDSAVLTILDAFHEEVEQQMSTGRGPAAAIASGDSTRLYIANAGDGSVEALDVQNRTVLASTHAGASPSALALTPDERFLVVADAEGSSLAVLGTAPFNPKSTIPGSPLPLITTIPVGSRPVDVSVPNWLR